MKYVGVSTPAYTIPKAEYRQTNKKEDPKKSSVANPEGSGTQRTSKNPTSTNVSPRPRNLKSDRSGPPKSLEGTKTPTDAQTEKKKDLVVEHFQRQQRLKEIKEMIAERYPQIPGPGSYHFYYKALRELYPLGYNQYLKDIEYQERHQKGDKEKNRRKRNRQRRRILRNSLRMEYDHRASVWPKADRDLITSKRKVRYTWSVPGPGAYKINPPIEYVDPKKGITFGYKFDDSDYALFNRGEDRAQSLENGEPEVDYVVGDAGNGDGLSRSVEVDRGVGVRGRKPIPGPACYEPTFDQVWGHSAAFSYNELISVQLKQKVIESLTKRIEKAKRSALRGGGKLTSENTKKLVQKLKELVAESKQSKHPKSGKKANKKLKANLETEREHPKSFKVASLAKKPQTKKRVSFLEKFPVSEYTKTPVIGRRHHNTISKTSVSSTEDFLKRRRNSALPRRSVTNTTEPDFRKRTSSKESLVPSTQNPTSSKKSPTKKVVGTFGTAPKFCDKEKKKGGKEPDPVSPGPGEYKAIFENLLYRMERGHGARLLGKLNYDNEINANPGPGAYQIDRDHEIGAEGKGFTMGHRYLAETLAVKGKAKQPGPGQYELTDFPTPPSLKLSRKQKEVKRLGELPSSAYMSAEITSKEETSKTKEHYKHILNSIINGKTRLSKRKGRTGTKGSQSYRPKKKTLTKGPKFPKARRSVSEYYNKAYMNLHNDMTTNVFQKQINTARNQSGNIHHPSAFRGLAVKQTRRVAPPVITPGPAKYNLRDVDDKILPRKCYTIGKRMRYHTEEVNKDRFNFPGPGSYNLHRFPETFGLVMESISPEKIDGVLNATTSPFNTDLSLGGGNLTTGMGPAGGNQSSTVMNTTARLRLQQLEVIKQAFGATIGDKVEKLTMDTSPKKSRRRRMFRESHAIARQLDSKLNTVENTRQSGELEMSQSQAELLSHSQKKKIATLLSTAGKKRATRRAQKAKHRTASKSHKGKKFGHQRKFKDSKESAGRPFDEIDSMQLEDGRSQATQQEQVTTEGMKAKALSFVAEERMKKLRGFLQKRLRTRTKGASMTTSQRPMMKANKKKRPGPGSYNLRGELGNGNAVAWGKPQRADIIELKLKMLQNYGDVGPGSYNLISTIPQLQDWERFKIQNGG